MIILNSVCVSVGLFGILCRLVGNELTDESADGAIALLKTLKCLNELG